MNKSVEFVFKKKLSIEKSHKQYLTSKTLKQGKNNDEESITSPSYLCLGLHLFTINNKTLNTTINKNLIACVGTANFVFLIDLNTSSIIYDLSLSTVSGTSGFLPQNVEFRIDSTNNQIHGCLQSLFQNEILVIKIIGLFLNEHSNSREIYSESSNSEGLSVIPQETVLKTSPLNEEISEKELVVSKNPYSVNSMQDYLKTQKNSSTILKNKNSSVLQLDKPIVFNSRIKSSGYSTLAKK